MDNNQQYYPPNNGAPDPSAQQAPYSGNPYASGQGNPYSAPPYGYQPPANGVPPYAAAAINPNLRRSTLRDRVMAILVAVLSFTMVDSFLWFDTLGLGFAVGSVLMMAVSLWYLRPHRRHTGFYTVACVFTFILGGVSLFFSADKGIKFLALLCMMILYVCILMDIMEVRLWTPGTLRSVGDFFYTAFACSFGRVGRGMYGLFNWEKNNEKKGGKGFGKALLGLLIALPLVIILIILLSSADFAFSGMLKGIDFGDPSKVVTSVFLTVPVFILLFCQLYSIRFATRERREESGKGLDPTIVFFFLLGVSLVYIAYLFSQLAYFFNGFLGFLPEEFTYAEYARRGFFELSAVGVINFSIVALVTAFCRRNEGKLPIGAKLMSLFLCLFSLVLVFTEVAKMKMYMDNYGLTRLRILTTLFMVFLAFVFLALIVHIFAKKFPYMKVAVIVGVLLVMVMNFISVDRMVAEYNVWAYESGALKTVDVDTITELGDAAVPSLFKLAEKNNGKISDKARNNLYIRWKNLHEYGDTYEYRIGELKPYDFRGFNLTTYEARSMLLENESKIMKYR